MLVARTTAGDRVEASRRMPTAPTYVCPMCESRLIAKPGRVRVPHFAHDRTSDCPASGEGVHHLLAKKALAEEFRAANYDVVIEEAHPEHSRRIDLAVTTSWIDRRDGKACLQTTRFSVEVQDSPISPREMGRRQGIDVSFLECNPVWVFIGSRAKPFLDARSGAEVRCSREALSVMARRGHVLCYDVDQHELWRVVLQPVVRDGGLYPNTKLKTIRTISKRRIGFRIFGERAWELPEQQTPSTGTPKTMRSTGDEQRLRVAEAVLASRWLDRVPQAIERADLLTWNDLEYVAATALNIRLGERQQLWIRQTLLSIVCGCQKAITRGRVIQLSNPRSPLALHVGCTHLVENAGVPYSGVFGHDECPTGGPPRTPTGIPPDGWPPPTPEPR